MKKCLLFATLLVAMFGNTSLWAQKVTAEAGTDGYFTTSGDYPASYESTGIRGENTNKDGAGNYINYRQVDATTPTKNLIRAGYTFAGWNSGYVNNRRAIQDANGAYLPFTITSPISTNRKLPTSTDKDFTINFWAYMDNWDEVANKDMRLISCEGTNTGWYLGNGTGDQFPWTGNIPDAIKGTYNNGCITWYVYMGGKPVFASTPKKWKDLEDKTWHMFTLSLYKCTWANAYYATIYVDGNDANNWGRYTSDLTYRIPSESKYNIMIGNTPSNDNQHKFTGQIRGLSIIDGCVYTRENYEYDGQMDAMVKDWYNNSKSEIYRTYVDTPNRPNTTNRTITAAWKENEKTTTNFDDLPSTGTQASFSRNTISQPKGIGDVLTLPSVKDYLFVDWANTSTGIDYVSKLQEFVPAFKYSDLSGNGQSVEVEFDGEGGEYPDYYVIGENSTAQKDTKKWTDQFTINVWAYMKNWSDYTSGMRLFSCTETGGFNIESTDTDAEKGGIRFVGYNEGVGYENATAKKEDKTIYKWKDLGENKWHMFTYVFTGKYVQGYIDGELVAYSNEYSKKAMGYNTKEHNKIFIGAEPNQNADKTPAPPGYFFKGKMRDFGIMHTALLPNQVKAMYDNPNKSYYVFPNRSATLNANWKDISLGISNANDEKTLIGTAVEQEIEIKGNGFVTPTVSVTGEGWAKVSEKLNAKGGTVTISYNPSTVDKHPATITVTEDTYNTPKSTTVTGKAYRPFEYDAPVQVKHVWKGEPFEQELKVVGDGWTAPSAELTVDGTAPFSIDKSLNTSEDSKITLTYTPTAVGVHKAKLKVQSNSDYAPNAKTEEVEIAYHAHEFDVAYWKDNGFTVKLDDELREGTNISFNSAAISLVEDRDGTYFFEFTEESAVDNHMKALENTEITFTSKDGSWDLSKVIKVRYVNETGENVTNDKHDELTDVIVTAGKQLSHKNGSESRTIRNLYVKPGATFTVENSATYSANTIFLFSEGDEMPYVSIPAGSSLKLRETNAKKTIYFVKRIKGDRYYSLSLPFDCMIEDIRMVDGTSKRGEDWDVLTYDGARRVQYGDDGRNWVQAPGDKLEAGKGYTVAVNATGETMREILFPMHLTDADLSELDNEEKGIEIFAYGSDKVNEVRANHLGWNLVGNPYFAPYAYGKIVDDQAQSGIFKKGYMVANEWKDDGNIYLSIPVDGGRSYIQQLHSQIKMKPFDVFFIQVAAGKELIYTLAAAEQPQGLAPRKVASATANPVYVGVKLSNGSLDDETSLVIGKQFTQAYEIGYDLEKMLGLTERPQVYVIDSSNKYAFKAVNPTDAAGINDLGVYLPAEGTYTFSIKDTYDLSQVQALYLTDRVEGVTVNLVQTDYTFTSTKAHTTNRFTLGVALSADVATNLTETEANWAVWQDSELHIRLQGLNVGDEIRVFDITGRLIHQTQAIETEAAFDLPTAGTYCVQTIGEAGNVQIKKINIK